MREKDQEDVKMSVLRIVQSPNSVGGVIREYRMKRGLNQPQLAAKLGVTKNAVTNWESGHSHPSLATIPALCATLGISADVLFGIASPKRTLSREEKEHLLRYRALNAYQRDTVDLLMVSMAENERKEFRDRCKAQFIRIPRIPLAASAGTGNLLEERYEQEEIYLRDSWETRKADMVVKVSGDSMQPTFYDGDEILLERTDAIEPGEIGVFSISGEAFVKEYQPDGLHSHNPHYDTIRIAADEEVRCVGRVLGTISSVMYASEREQTVLNELYAENEGLVD